MIDRLAMLACQGLLKRMSRAGAFLALTILFSGCTPKGSDVPFTDSRAPAGLGAGQLPPSGWAWGYIQTGQRPPQRYGVTSPPIVPKADIVILPGYGESAEVWFETVRDLVLEGYTVWVLERAGQGGSGRYVLPRDMGYVPSFEPDISTLRAFVRTIVRPRIGRPLILVGYADGAVVGLRAVQTGLIVDGIVMVSPMTTKPFAHRIIGLERFPSPGWKPWHQRMPDDFTRGLTHDRLRGSTRSAWQAANPDLRMAGPSRGWIAAFGEASHQALDQAAATEAPILVITGNSADADIMALCRSAKHCRARKIADAKQALHLESDKWRRPWLEAVKAFIDLAAPTSITAHEP